jgi:precorrin-4/cobalt-precorrin-4 C11-methyltransferase
MDLGQAMIVAGVGCRKGASADDIGAVIADALARAGIPADALDLIATPELKAGERGIAAAAAALGVPLVLIPKAAMEAAGARASTRSERVLALTGVPSVAEAAALAAGGPQAQLIVPRIAAGTATCAIGHRRRAVMTVHFIGAGPGAADLITVRGRDLLGRCPVCLYAGSIVPPELLAYCPARAKVVDTAPMTLDEIEAEYVGAHAAGHDVARLHSGDLSVFSAVAEQIRRLERHAIPYTLTPGVPAFAAAAALLGRELTVPEIAQSVILTRVPGRASPMPPGERLDAFAATGATLVLHLAIQAIDTVVAELTPRYGEDCPVAVVARATWPDERIVQGTLADIKAKLATESIERTAVILVGPALAAQDFRESALYDPSYRRRFRGDERP